MLSDLLPKTEQQRLWAYYTRKLIILLGASLRAESLDFRLVWVRHALAIMDIRDQYERKGL